MCVFVCVLFCCDVFCFFFSVLALPSFSLVVCARCCAMCMSARNVHKRSINRKNRVLNCLACPHCVAHHESSQPKRQMNHKLKNQEEEKSERERGGRGKTQKLMLVQRRKKNTSTQSSIRIVYRTHYAMLCIDRHTNAYCWPACSSKPSVAMRKDVYYSRCVSRMYDAPHVCDIMMSVCCVCVSVDVEKTLEPATRKGGIRKRKKEEKNRLRRTKASKKGEHTTHI